MIGQTKLVEKLNNLSLNDIPNALILCGDYGCGKHTYVNLISKKFEVDVVDISKIIGNSSEAEKAGLSSDDIQIKLIPTIYLINSNEVTSGEHAFSKILKLLEDYNKFAYIMILCDTLSDLPDTIINRCKIWKFEDYSVSDLQSIKIIDENYYSILNTPGKLLEIGDNISEFFDTANKIFQYADIAIISNLLVLTDKLSYNKHEDNKLNFSIFKDILYNSAINNYRNNVIGFEAVLLTNKLIRDSKLCSIDKKKLYEGYLIDLKNEIRRFKANY